MYWVLLFRGSCFSPHPVMSLPIEQDSGTKVVPSLGAQASDSRTLFGYSRPWNLCPDSCRPVCRACMGISPSLRSSLWRLCSLLLLQGPWDDARRCVGWTFYLCADETSPCRLELGVEGDVGQDEGYVPLLCTLPSSGSLWGVQTAKWELPHHHSGAFRGS